MPKFTSQFTSESARRTPGREASRRRAFGTPAVAATIAIGALVTGAPGAAIAAAPALHAATATQAGEAIEHPPSHRSLLRESARDRSVVVVLFSLEGCAYCAAIRSDQLRHLAREARARNLRVVEYGIDDRRAFRDADEGAGAPASATLPAASAGLPASPAELAARLGVRVAPTVAFLGPDGSELAERLVGYSSPDFYGAYLERRIATARERLASN